MFKNKELTTGKEVIKMLAEVDSILEKLVNNENTEEVENKLLYQYTLRFSELKNFYENQSKEFPIPQNLTYLSHYFSSEMPRRLELVSIEKGIERLRYYDRFIK